MEQYLTATILGVAFGAAARGLMLRSDYRQFPAFPHGFVTHLSLGFIAAVLGALAIPALWEKEFTAVTFLSLAATQFRDIREVERKTLTNLDKSNLVPRGPDYIEGIAHVFEARNYLVMLIALVTSGISYLIAPWAGILAGLVMLAFSMSLMGGKVLSDIAIVRPGKIHFEGPNVFVDEIHFMNLAREEVRRMIMERGLGVIIEPKDDDARATLANNGQRMAIAHDAAIQLGIYKDVDTAEFTPILRRNLDSGRIGLLIVPQEPDMDSLVEAVKRVPILESARSRPLQSRPGRKAAD